MNAFDILNKLKAESATLKHLGVASLKLFGSYARNEAAPTSDADFLVRFNTAPNFDGFMDLKFFLEDRLGLTVDLVKDNALRAEMRASIEKDALLVA
jgi:predicted nucleotidyltransferase